MSPVKQKLTENLITAEVVAFGFQGGKKKQRDSEYFVAEQITTEVKDTRLSQLQNRQR
ncbi:MAG: hypothetical protein QW468_00030 [Candidatus Bathyarchaeia archaeon]